MMVDDDGISTDDDGTGTDGDDPDPTDFEGTLDFVLTFGGSELDEAVGIVEANDGNYVILGSTKSTDGDLVGRTGNDYDYWLLKTTPEGQKLWSQTYGGSLDDRASSISKTSDGGFLLSGYTRSTDGDLTGQNNGFHDFWIVKVNSQGDLVWDQTFGFAGSDQAFTAFETSDGGFFTSGFFDVDQANGGGNDDRASRHGVGEFWAIKMDASGEWVWRRFFGGFNNDRSYDAVETQDGGFLVTGASESNDFDITDPKGSYDFWIVQIDATGNLVWEKSYGGSGIEECNSVVRTSDGNYILAGDTRSTDQDVTNPKGNADAWLIKINATNGGIIWQKTFGGPEFDSAENITAISENRYLVAATTRSASGDISVSNGKNDAWAFIISEEGTIEFEIAVGGSELDFGHQAIETIDNKIVLVGNTESTDGNISLNRGRKDLMLIKIK